MSQDPDHQQREYRIEDARQGQVVLRHRWSRIIFIAGLVAILILPFVIAAMHG